MDEIEIPEYFICPISLQIMKDPVTTITGISYDRESIEQWLKTTKEPTCPATKQPLNHQSELTSNHTLRRLIQSWCTLNSIERIPTPKAPLNKKDIRKLVRDLEVPQLHMNTLKKMVGLAMENERNRKCMEEETSVAKAIVLSIVRCYKDNKTNGLDESLRILRLVWSPDSPQWNEIKILVNDNYDFINSLTWVLRCEEFDDHVVKTNAITVLKMVLEIASTRLLENLKLDFFKQLVALLKKYHNLSPGSPQTIKSVLQVMIEACPWGRNRMKIIEANTVFELIELELRSKPDQKNITELIFNLLAQLCSCADGRFQFLGHAGGIAIVSKRILRVSRATDDLGIRILTSISKYSATREVLLEMLRVGAVTKLCMVTQADRDKYLKKKATDILRLHSNVWNDSPCIAVYLLTRYQ